jgi:hypothetical protein
MIVIYPFLLMSTHSEDFAINMDPFSYDPKRTLQLVGNQTVYICKSVSDTKCVTCAMTVTASGKIFPPMMVFKGIAGKSIKMCELPTFDQSMLYICQSDAWMDEQVMLLGVKKILKNHSAL